MLEYDGPLQKTVDMHTYSVQWHSGWGDCRCAHVYCKHMVVKRRVGMNANGHTHVQYSQKVVRRGECEGL